MDDLEKLQELTVSVAKLETSMEFTLKQNEKLDAKLDLILVNINKSGSEREADLHSLKFALKKKINDSLHELKMYHDGDLKTINEHIERMKWAQWPSKYPKATAFIIVSVALTVFETAWGSRELIKEIVEFFT